MDDGDLVTKNAYFIDNVFYTSQNDQINQTKPPEDIKNNNKKRSKRKKEGK